MSLGSRADVVVCSNVLMHLDDPFEPILDLCAASQRALVLSVYGTSGSTVRTDEGPFVAWKINPYDITDRVRGRLGLVSFQRHDVCSVGAVDQYVFVRG